MRNWWRGILPGRGGRHGLIDLVRMEGWMSIFSGPNNREWPPSSSARPGRPTMWASSRFANCSGSWRPTVFPRASLSPRATIPGMPGRLQGRGACAALALTRVGIGRWEKLDCDDANILPYPAYFAISRYRNIL